MKLNEKLAQWRLCDLPARASRRYNHVVTAKEALDAANDAEPGERLRRYETVCGADRADANRSRTIRADGCGARTA